MIKTHQRLPFQERTERLARLEQNLRTHGVEEGVKQQQTEAVAPQKRRPEIVSLGAKLIANAFAALRTTPPLTGDPNVDGVRAIRDGHQRTDAPDPFERLSGLATMGRGLAAITNVELKALAMQQSEFVQLKANERSSMIEGLRRVLLSVSGHSKIASLLATDAPDAGAVMEALGQIAELPSTDARTRGQIGFFRDLVAHVYPAATGVVGEAVAEARAQQTIDAIEAHPTFQAAVRHFAATGRSAQVGGGTKPGAIYRIFADGNGLFVEVGHEWAERRAIEPHEAVMTNLTVKGAIDALTEFAAPGATEAVLAERAAKAAAEETALAGAEQTLAAIEADPTFQAAIAFLGKTRDRHEVARDPNPAWFIGIYVGSDGLTKDEGDSEHGAFRAKVEPRDVLATGLTLEGLQATLKKIAGPDGFEGRLEARRQAQVQKEQQLAQAEKDLGAFVSDPRYLEAIVKLGMNEKTIALGASESSEVRVAMDSRGVHTFDYEGRRSVDARDLVDTGLTLDAMLAKLP